MGGNIKNKNGKNTPTEAQIAAKAAEQKQKEKKSLLIRGGIGLAVLIAAIIACVFMLTHDFNPDRDVLHGTYYAERRFFYDNASGTDLSDINKTIVITFCDDGRMVFKYNTGSRTYYYEYEEGADEPYDGTIIRYAEGALLDTMNVIREENGDLTLHYTVDALSFTVADLVQTFGEKDTLDMLKGVYDDETCALLVSGDYDSLTDAQLSAMGVTREQVPELSFSIKNLSTVMTMYKVSDDELTRKKTLEIWNAQFVSDTDMSGSDVSASDGE